MTKSKDREFLEFLHARMLWKIVNKNEFKIWLKKIDDGLSWEEVLKDFTNSSIFHLRVGEIITSVVGQN